MIGKQQGGKEAYVVVDRKEASLVDADCEWSGKTKRGCPVSDTTMPSRRSALVLQDPSVI